MTVRVAAEVLDLTAVSGLRGAWEALASRPLEASIFNDPGFLLAAARHLSAAPGPSFLTAWRREEGGPRILVGLCPVIRPWGPRFAAAAAWLHPQAVAAFPLLDRTHASAALEALLAGAARLPGRPAAILFSGVDRAGPTAALLHASEREVSVVEERSRAVLLREGQPLGLSTKTRRELRRLRNRLEEQGAVEVRSASSSEEVGPALERFFALEQKGWKGRRGTALASRPATRAFAREAVQALGKGGQCRIESLEVGGDPAAMGVVFRSENRAFYWKTAYDENVARFSPGLQLTQSITERQAEDPAILVTDSCAIPGHSMIDRVWRDRVTVADLLVATEAGRSAAFGLARRLERGRRDVRAFAKRLLHRAKVGHP